MPHGESVMVEHQRLAAKRELSVGHLAEIEVLGMPLARFTERYPSQILGRLPPDVTIVEGQDHACIEGCKGNSQCILEMLYNDYHGRGGWSLVYGKGLDRTALENLSGDILIAGPCAVGKAATFLRQHYPNRKVYIVNAHNDLMLNTTYQARLSGITPVKMVPLNPIASAWLLLQAKLHGLTSLVPPLLG